METESALVLNKQLCFPIYATSRLIIKLYQPLLDELGLTYTQYLVMMVLWEKNGLKMTDIGKKLYLNTNTLTPLVSKLINKGLLTKKRSEADERTVLVSVTENGKEMQEKAECIPGKLAQAVDIPIEDVKKLKTLMWDFLNEMESKNY